MINKETITKIKMEEAHENMEALHSNISHIGLCLCGMDDLNRPQTNMGLVMYPYLWTPRLNWNL